jgi:1,4-alpha-glucan branching enzyme
MSGMRYWRVTGAKMDLADKKEYEPDKTEAQLDMHAYHFSDVIYQTLAKYRDETNKEGVLVAPFDTELFGHWWFEGPYFLEKVMRKILDAKQIRLTTASEEFDRQQPSKVISIPEGSWGEGGHHYIWLNKLTDWTWKHIYEDEVRFNNIVKKYSDSDDEKLKSILSQAARELLLLQSSDWQFLITTISASEYASTRLVNHHTDFNRLLDLAEKYFSEKSLPVEDWNYFEEVVKRDPLFTEINLNWWKDVEFPAI